LNLTRGLRYIFRRHQIDRHEVSENLITTTLRQCAIRLTNFRNQARSIARRAGLVGSRCESDYLQYIHLYHGMLLNGVFEHFEFFHVFVEFLHNGFGFGRFELIISHGVGRFLEFLYLHVHHLKMHVESNKKRTVRPRLFFLEG